MDAILQNLGLVALALVLVLINGFFVAAEFALVKVRPTKIDSYVAQKRSFAKLVRVQLRKLDAALSACQLGITLASLGLGWIGEPALAKLIRPILHSIGIHSNVLLHTVTFAIAFAIITAIHLVIGEQVPKIYAVKNPEKVACWCALPLKMFYIVAYPFLSLLNESSNFLLRRLGVADASEHEGTHSEEEIRALLGQAHSQGELSRLEHRLLNAVFEFDDRVVREVMVPRRDVEFFEAGKPIEHYLQQVRSSHFSRFPFCKGSLDDVEGVIHIRDLVGIGSDFDIHSILRPALRVTESMEIGKLLKHFQTTKQHIAFVMDEFGNVIGMVTLENVLEEIVGAVQDEFDEEKPTIAPDEKGGYQVDGGVSVNKLSRDLRVAIDEGEAETISGLITERLGRLPQIGDKMELGEISTEVLEVVDGCAELVRVHVVNQEDDSESN